MQRSIIRKITLIGVLVLVLTTMVGCGTIKRFIDLTVARYNYIHSYDKNGEILENAGNQITDALVKKDIEALKEVMSLAALETDDFEKGFEYSCSFFDENDEIVSKEFSGYNNGTYLGVSTFGSRACEITTASGKIIVVSYKCYYMDKENPKNVGVYSLVVTSAGSAVPDERSDYFRSRAGIYNPEWNDYM